MATPTSSVCRPPPGFLPKLNIREHVTELIQNVHNFDTREDALRELSKLRSAETIPDFAELLWHSFGTMTILTEEIQSVYVYITNPPTLSSQQAKRVGCVLDLLEVVATDEGTRRLFLEAKILELLIPYLQTTAESKPIEYLRLTTLILIGTIVKGGQTEVLKLLLPTDLIPLCFWVMSYDNIEEATQYLGIYILHEILLNDVALNYYCQTCTNFTQVAKPLANLVVKLDQKPNAKMAKQVIECYLRLSKLESGIEGLRFHIPMQISDPNSSFLKSLENEDSTKELLSKLINEINSSLPLFMYDYTEDFNGRKVSKFLDVINASYVSENLNSSDIPDAPIVTEIPDTSNVTEISDGLNVMEISDVPNVKTILDAPNVTDILDVVDTSIPHIASGDADDEDDDDKYSF